MHTVKTCDHIHIVNTDKNRRTRYLLGITVEDQEQIVRDIELSDYISGPEADHDLSYSGSVWKFKVYAFGHTIYVKLKDHIITRDGMTIKAISCHIDHMI